MATLRDIRRRITSVTGTQQITSAMKMVSAAKLNRAQQAALAAQPYAMGLRNMVTTISRGLTAEDHPLLGENPEGKTALLLYTSDRGLCGGFNSNLLKFVVRSLTKQGHVDPELIIVGRVGNDYFRRRAYLVTRSVVQLTLTEKQARIREAIDELVQRYITGDVGRVLVAYNRFFNPMRQDPTLMQLLPVVAPEPGAPGTEDAAQDERESLFEPSRVEILSSLLPRYVENQCTLSMLNTEAGEHGARMVAMESATKNAGEMISRLTLQYNRVRQAAITKELIEVINGAQSL
jgi:F-type H+-transporting ATPase subunit gamma